MIYNNLSHTCSLLARCQKAKMSVTHVHRRDCNHWKQRLTPYCISMFARGGACARNVIVGSLWPKADDFFQPLFSHWRPNAYTDISATGQKWPKKHHTCGRNFKHCQVNKVQSTNPLIFSLFSTFPDLGIPTYFIGVLHLETDVRCPYITYVIPILRTYCR